MANFFDQFYVSTAPRSGRRIPAAIRTNNPGAMWPGPSATRFGSTGHELLNDGQGNKIARFDTPEQGAAAQFDLLNRRYAGMSVNDAIRKWSGGNSSSAYAASVAQAMGMRPTDVLSRDILADPQRAIPLARAMARIEAGRDYPMSDEQWQRGYQMYAGGQPMAFAGTPQKPEGVMAIEAAMGGGNANAPQQAPAQAGGNYFDKYDSPETVQPPLNYFDKYDEPLQGTTTQPPQTGTSPSGRPSFDVPLGQPQAPAAQPAGIWNNATAGLNDAIYSTLGAPVDAATWLTNKGIQGVNAVAGTELPQVRDNLPGSSRSIAGAFETIGVNDPANVEARSTEEKLARAAGAGAGYTIAPEAILGALGRAGLLSEGVWNALTPLFGRSAGLGDVAMSAGVGAAAGAGGQMAANVVPEPYKPLAETMGNLAGGAVGVGAVAAGRGVAQLPQAVRDFRLSDPATQERAAGQVLQQSASDPWAVRAALDTEPRELVPGSQPTTFQVTGDMGLGNLERGAQTIRPEPFQQRRADQNAARVGALEGVQPTGAPEQVVTALRQHLADIDANTTAALERATAEAQARTAAMGGAGTPEGYGADMRGLAQPRVDAARTVAQQATDMLGLGAPPEVAGSAARGALSAAETAARVQERALWKAVDPDGTLALPATETKKTALDIARSQPRSAKPMEGEERAIFVAAARLPEVAPFKEVAALRSRISTAMRQELRDNGQTPVYARMAQLRGRLEADIEGAVSAKAAQEADAVASGAMREDDAMAARLLRETNEWRNRQEDIAAGRGNAAGSREPGAASTAAFSSGPRGPSQARRGFGNSPGDQGVQGPRLEPNFDEAAATRLSEASEATKARAQTFGGGAVGQVLRREGTGGPYNIPDSAVPSRFLRPGPGGKEAVESYRKAVGDDAALVNLQDYAVSELRRLALRPDGTLDPTKAASWVRQHMDALRAFPDLARKLSSTMKASRLLDEAAMFPEGALNADVASQVFRPGPGGYERVTRFIDGVGEPRASAVVQDYALNRLRAAAERPDGTLDPAKVELWRRRHADALRAFPELDRIVADPLRASEAMEVAAIQRKQAMDSFQAGTTARLLNLEDPADITRTLGAGISRQDAAREMGRIRSQLKGNPEALEGLKKGIAEHITTRFLSNTEVGTSGLTGIKSDAFQTFLRQNAQALRNAGFSETDVGIMRAIAADLQRSARSLNAVRIPGQANTAQDIFAAGRAGAKQSWLASILSSGGLASLGAAVGSTVGGGLGAAAGGGLGSRMGGVVQAMRKAGLDSVDDIVRDALLNPDRAKALLAKVSAEPTRREALTLAQIYLRAALVPGSEKEPERRATPAPHTPTGPRSDATRMLGL